MVPVATDVLQMVIVIPNLMLALAYSMNFYPIFKGKFVYISGMKDARDEKMAKASITGVAACSIFYILVGNMGYCLFGNHL
jgi:amino acid permease